MIRATVSWIIPDKPYSSTKDGEAFGLTLHAGDQVVVDIATSTVDKLDLMSLRKLTRVLAKFLEMPGLEDEDR